MNRKQRIEKLEQLVLQLSVHIKEFEANQDHLNEALITAGIVVGSGRHRHRFTLSDEGRGLFRRQKLIADHLGLKFVQQACCWTLEKKGEGDE